MAIAEDATTPATVTASSGASLTTASFSPPAKSLLVAMSGIAWSTGTATVVISDSGVHTWTNGAYLLGTGSNVGVSMVAFTYFATAPGAITVTSTFTGVNGGEILAVKVLTGAAAIQTGAGTATIYQAGSTDGTVSVTTTQPGSMVYGVSGDPNSNDTFTVNGATTLVTLNADTANGDAIATWKAANATGTPGVTALGGTWGSAIQGTAVGLEILPVTPSPLPIRIIRQAVKRAAFY